MALREYAVGYIRTAGKDTKGFYSVAAQMERIMVLAERDGVVIDQWFIDEDTPTVSPSHPTPKGIVQIVLIGIDEGLDVVFVASPDRISRKPDDVRWMLCNLNSMGIDVFFVSHDPPLLGGHDVDYATELVMDLMPYGHYPVLDRHVAV